MIGLCLPLQVFANALQVTFQNQTPVNDVPVGNAITYQVETRNIDDDSNVNNPSDIGVGITIKVNGNTVRADSGEFTSSNCVVDNSFPSAWACSDLVQFGSQSASFTWTSPTSGTSTVDFQGSCQILPATTPTTFCSSAGSDFTTTVVDSHGTIQFSASTYSVNEDDGSVLITVERSGASASSISSVRWTLSNGSATDGNDYIAGTGVETFFEGDNSEPFSVTILDDALLEGDETITLTLSDPTGGATLGTPSTATLTIIDIERGTIQFDRSSYTVDEDDGTANIFVTRVGGSEGDQEVDVVSSNGSAVSPDDYQSTFDILSWSDGESDTKTVTIPIVNDALVEGAVDETVNLEIRLSTGDSAALGTPIDAVLSIVDDDSIESGTIQFSLSNYNVNENAGTVDVFMTRTGGSDGDVSVIVNTNNLSATKGSDYRGDGPMQPFWSDGDSSTRTLTITLLDDTEPEGDETFEVVLSDPSGGVTIGNPNPTTVTIIDIERGTIQLSASTYSVDEADGEATIFVTREGGSEGDQEVDVVTSNGSAVSPEDYQSTFDILSWSDGESDTKTVTIPIVNDALFEGDVDETVNIEIRLSTGDSAELGTPIDAVLTIVDDDIVVNGKLQFSESNYNVNENDGTVEISVSRNGGSDGVVSVEYASSDDSATLTDNDYMAVSGSLIWADGDTTDKTFNVTITGDTKFEGDESLNLTLSNSSPSNIVGNPNPVTVTILNDDPSVNGILQFSASNYNVNENEGTVEISVSRTGGSDGVVSVEYASSDGSATLADNDYTAVSGTLTWIDGDTADKVFSVTITGDSKLEGDETLNLTLNNASQNDIIGSPNPVTVTILNDDTTDSGMLKFSASNYNVNENDGTVEINVSRNGGSDGVVSVDYASSDDSATQADNDYTAVSGTLTWADGDTAGKTFNVPITGDSRFEVDETLNLILSNASPSGIIGSTNIATITILNDDLMMNSSLQFSSNVYEVAEDNESVLIMVTRIDGSDGAVSVDYASSDSTAIAGTDYTSVSGTLTWADGDVAAKEFRLNVSVDQLAESAETITLILSNATGQVVLGNPKTAILTINDVEPELPTELILGKPGELVTGEIAIASGSPEITIVVEHGSVTPSFIEGSSGTVEYSFQVPEDAKSGAVFEDTLTWTDSADNVTRQTVEVSLMLSDISNLDPAQETTAEALDEVCGDATDDLGDRCQDLSQLDDAEAREALSQIAPKQVTNLGNSTIGISNTQVSNIQARLVALRGGVSGLSLGGLALNYRGDYLPFGNMARAVINHTNRLNIEFDEDIQRNSSADSNNGFVSPWGAFINGRIDIGEQDATANGTGYDFTTQGITLGVDYRYSYQLVVGGALGFANTDVDLSAGSGTQDIDAMTFMTFGNFYPSEASYLDWIVSYGRSDYQLSRNINFTGVSTHAKGETKGDLTAIALSAGGNFNKKEWLLTPYGRIEWVRVTIDAYSETGGDGLALKLSDQTISSVTTAFGGQVSVAINKDWGILTPSIKLEWEHEFRDDARLITARFVESPDAILNLPTDEPDRNYANAGISLSATFADSKVLALSYESVLGKEGYSSSTIQLTGRMAF